ncbi:RNA polymerase subunit sigma-70, partial [uncultured Selenomonas sp.]|uniref:RNA polymerase subunit sigma-70 n=1 Tax=uncultured Selenomonas sp. TaxID=159275 RepID=UPI0028DB4C87
MTEQEKSKIRSLRTEGYGYKKIALAVGISVNTVKSFCRNNELTGNSSSAVCLACGKPLVQMPKRKQRKFCSAQCREKWWNKNRDKGNKPTGET